MAFRLVLSSLLIAIPDTTSGNLLSMSFLPPSALFSSSKVLRIGTALTLDESAKYGTLGAALKNSYVMYFDWLNTQRGGVMIDGTLCLVELVFIDDKSETTLVANITNYLLDTVGLRILLAPYSSGLTAIASAKAHETDALIIAAGASSTSVFSGRPTVFGTLPPAFQYLPGAFEMIGLAGNGSRKTVALVQEDKSWTLSICGQVSGLSSVYNMDLLVDGSFTIPADAGEDIAAGVVNQLGRLAPDIVTMCVYRTSCHAMLKQMRIQNFYAKAILSTICVTESDFLDVLGTAGQYILGVTPWMHEFPLTSFLADGWTAENFAEEYQSRYGYLPPYQAASAWASVAVLMRAIEDANSTDVPLITEQLRRANYASIFGTMAFDANGQCTNKMKVVQFQGSPSAKLVYPPENRNAVFVYPKPSWADMECTNLDRGVNSRFGFTNEVCAECALGKHSVVVDASRLCVKCGYGKMGLDGDYQFCIDCTPGSYSDIEGAHKCQFCPAGSYANFSGLSGCLICHKGSVSQKIGQPACSGCIEGTYSSAKGSTYCAKCQIGRYSSILEATSCVSCDKGATRFPGSTLELDCICPVGQFADSDSKCRDCLRGMDCPLGSDMRNYMFPSSSLNSTRHGAYPSLRRGFWSSQVDPLSVFECEDEWHCPGGDPGVCGNRLEKASCSRCVEGWRWTGQKCVECTPIETSQILFPLLPVLACPLVIILMYMMFGDTLTKWGSWQNGCCTVCFVVLNHYQLINLLSSGKMEEPSPMTEAFDFWSFTNDILGILRIHCGGWSFSNHMLFKACGPLLIAGVCSLVFVNAKFMFNIGCLRLRMDGNRLFNVFGSIMYTFFVAIVAASMSLFKCTDNPNDKLTLAADLSVICYESEEWKNMLGISIVSCIMYVVGFGSVLAYILRIAPARFAGNPYFQMRWKFLFIKYRPTVWWWSLAFLARNLFLNVFMVVFTVPLHQFFAIFTLIILYLILFGVYLPYRHRIVNPLEFVVGISIMYVSGVLIAIAYRKDAGHTYTLATLAVLIHFMPLTFACVSVAWLRRRFELRKSENISALLVRMAEIASAFQVVDTLESSQVKEIVDKLSDWDRFYLGQVWHFAATELLGQETNQARCRGISADTVAAITWSSRDLTMEISGILSSRSSNVGMLCCESPGYPSNSDSRTSPERLDQVSESEVSSVEVLNTGTAIVELPEQLFKEPHLASRFSL